MPLETILDLLKSCTWFRDVWAFSYEGENSIILSWFRKELTATHQWSRQQFFLSIIEYMGQCFLGNHAAFQNKESLIMSCKLVPFHVRVGGRWMTPSSPLDVRDIWDQGRKLNPVDSALYSVPFPCKSMTQPQEGTRILDLLSPCSLLPGVFLLYWAAAGSYFLGHCFLDFMHPSCCSSLLGLWSQVTKKLMYQKYP